ncbi:MAG: hypothetical protein LUD72_01000 [Bacteroidales bacterium]|nr:hypothetical protein [Bacteroidales bacterium]
MSNTQYEELREVRKGQTGTGLLIERDGHILGNCDAVMQMREDIESGHRFVVPEGGLHLVGLLQRANAVNANKRVYPMAVLEPCVNDYIRNRVEKNCAIGSMDHPSSSTLSGHDVSHNITRLWWEGTALMGELDLHLSPGYVRYGVCSTSGDLAANMILQGIRLGISSRALGTVREVPGGNLLVDNNLELLAWDLVCEPSTKNAWIARSRDELRSYMESTGKEGDAINEKIASISRVLNG